MTEPTSNAQPTASTEPPASAEPPANARLASPAAALSDRIAGNWLVPVLSLGWLAAKLWSSHRQIQTSGGGSIAVATAALALPGVIQATIAAGLGAGLIASTVLARGTVQARSSVLTRGSVLTRIAPAVAGLVIGLLSLGLILGVYRHLTSMATVAVSVAVAGLLGGAIVAARPAAAVLTAGLAGTLAAFVTATVLNSNTVLTHMMKTFGARDTFSSQLHANNVVAFVDSLIGGVIAGLVAYWYLRRQDAHRREAVDPSADGRDLEAVGSSTDGRDLKAVGSSTDGRGRIPAYLVAGAMTGAVLLVAELVTRVGGVDLLNAVRAISVDDRDIIDLLGSARMINAMVVIFVGAFVALVGYGRTIKPHAAPAPRRPLADRADPREAAE